MRRLPITLLLIISACASATTTGGEVGQEVDTTTSFEAPETSAPSATTGSAEFDNQELPDTVGPVVTDWETNFSKASIPLDELRVGIPARDPRDLIRPIDEPVFARVQDSEWLADVEPGVAIEIDGRARFYPLSIMARHEIVNDEIDGVPIAVTYCPLCNTALVFNPVIDGATHRFGVSGLLRNSDLVMWDDVTESLWQQITGEAIVGERTGTVLEPVPSRILRFADFSEAFPDGEVMSEDQGFGIQYGLNPYAGYSSQSGPIGAFVTADLDDRFPAMERVVGITTETQDKAYPFSILTERKAINDSVGGEPAVVLWGAPDTADALDSSVIANSAGVGTGVAYNPVVDGQTLTFEPSGDSRFTDIETGSTWTLVGAAVDGPLAGSQLDVLPHRNEFWFAWSAFFPEGDVAEG